MPFLGMQHLSPRTHSRRPHRVFVLGVVNTLLMSVMERLREFGVVLALGSSPNRLRGLVLLEALMLGLVAAAVGCVLGALLTWYLVEVGIDLQSFIPETLEFGGVVFDPVLPPRADGLTFDVGEAGHRLHYRFAVTAEGAGATEVRVNGRRLSDGRRHDNPYRVGGLAIARAAWTAALDREDNLVEVFA